MDRKLHARTNDTRDHLKCTTNGISDESIMRGIDEVNSTLEKWMGLGETTTR